MTQKKWSREATEKSDALDLERGAFSRESSREVARSVMRSAQRSRRRKSPPYRSAMSMLTFYINRAGRRLPAHRKNVLNRAKAELRKLRPAA